MTVTASPDTVTGGPPQGPSTSPPGPGGPGRPRDGNGGAGTIKPPPAGVGARNAGLFVAGSALTIIAALTLGLTAQVILLSRFQHERAQQIAYADFRGALANAVAPVSQTDLEGDLYPLGVPIAVLSIPSIGLREVVFEGTAPASS